MTSYDNWLAHEPEGPWFELICEDCPCPGIFDAENNFICNEYYHGKDPNQPQCHNPQMVAGVEAERKALAREIAERLRDVILGKV